MVKLNVRIVGTQIPVRLLDDLLMEFGNRGCRKQNRRHNQENFLGFSEYLAQYQKYLFQFKLESLPLQHYLVPGTTHTAQVVEFNIYKTKFEVSLCSCGGLFLTLPSRNI